MTDFKVSNIEDLFVGDQHPERIPDSYLSQFAPARFYLYEWTEYWLQQPGATHLKVGSTVLFPKAAGAFRLYFENQLGLSSIQAYSQDEPITPVVFVEILSRKFSTLESHLAFLGSLLEDLFASSARLPFAIDADISRNVMPSIRPPTPLFTLHFFYQYCARISAALAVVEASPHRILTDELEQVPVSSVSEIDADLILGIIRSPENWVRSRNPQRARTLMRDYVPEKVWHRNSQVTFDNPENRFIKEFVKQLITIGEQLQYSQLWEDVPSEKRDIVRSALSELRQSLNKSLFQEVGPIHTVPMSSQVLLRRDGYRDIVYFWQIFNLARKPFFSDLQDAIDLRDIDRLYEMWAFFAVIEDITNIFQELPHLELQCSDESGLQYNVMARFGQNRCLMYNLTYSRPDSYSLILRPDFSWSVNGQLDVVMDAKFRLQGYEFANQEFVESSAVPSDIYKMHTYRDALGIRSAICIFPSEKGSIFYDRSGTINHNFDLQSVLSGIATGVGAIGKMPLAK